MGQIHDLQWQHKKWLNHNFQHQEPWEPLLGIGEEVGELMHAHLKGKQGIRNLDNDVAVIKAKMDALGDIFIYMMSYANTNALDLENAVERAWNEVSKRDWITYPVSGVPE